MRKKEQTGTDYDPALTQKLYQNQNDITNTLTEPNPNRMSEMIGNPHKIVSSVPAYNPEAQPTQARGKIVWNNAYSFQSKGPSYLDGTDR